MHMDLVDIITKRFEQTVKKEAQPPFLLGQTILTTERYILYGHHSGKDQYLQTIWGDGE